VRAAFEVDLRIFVVGGDHHVQQWHVAEPVYYIVDFTTVVLGAFLLV